MTNFESAAFLFLPLSLISPFLPLPAFSFIPHKHSRYRAVLMRTEWTDPRPQHHWDPRHKSTIVMNSSKGPNVESQTLQCFVLRSYRRFPESFHYALSCSNIAEMLTFFLFFLYISTLEVFPIPFCKKSIVKLLTIPCLILGLYY